MAILESMICNTYNNDIMYVQQVMLFYIRHHSSFDACTSYTAVYGLVHQS